LVAKASIDMWVRSALLIAVLYGCAPADEIAPFTSDGCSAFPDGTVQENELWLHCCTEHDRAYWIGGLREERAAADQALKDCVAEVGRPHIAALMLAGVRVGGTPYLPTRFRWGYGWPYPRGYEAVPDEVRRKLIEASMRTADE
jgi:hypothetical protein